jgi:hypothetical protein
MIKPAEPSWPHPSLVAEHQRRRLHDLTRYRADNHDYFHPTVSWGRALLLRERIPRMCLIRTRLLHSLCFSIKSSASGWAEGASVE